MGTRTLSTGSGPFKVPQHATQNWKPDCKWPYLLIPRSKRFSFSLKCDQLQVGHNCFNSCLRLKNGSHGLPMPIMACCSRSHRYGSVLSLTKNSNTRWKKCTPRSCLGTALIRSRGSFRGNATPKLSSDYREEDDVEDTLGEVLEDGCAQETLKLLEWQAICNQVAQFATTPMGVMTAGEAKLTIGSNRMQSEALLEQTADAYALPRPLDLSGIENLHGFIEEAMAGTVCQTKELCVVKQTLTRLQLVRDQLWGSHGEYLKSLHSNAENSSPLQSLMLDCDFCSDLVSEIDHCLDCTLDTILDRASPALAAARLGRQDNMRALQALLKETASRIVQQGGIDSVIVTLRRSRLCIAVRSSHKSLLPGGLVLDISNTGTTSFMEPEPALRLNNEESRLAAVEKAEEMAVLRRLTLRLIDRADAIMKLLSRITMIDLACARASHAKWLGSVVPVFYDSVESSSEPKSARSDEDNTRGKTLEDLIVDIVGMRHPLLLGAALSDLSPPQRYGSAQYSNSPHQPFNRPSGESSALPNLPVPIDIKVKSGVRVVTITGPNTGGKTATLKALGVASIMAKAGLYIPAKGQPKLPWFDFILADVGDAQSLERNLSTFSGHIRRLCAILEICTNESFVLLDEIGGGTDPTEGAALATAVLQHLSSKVLLTVATSHSAELKTLKDRSSRFENASVEFDVKTLRPTYRVLWGMAGQSSALDIAESLGFDIKVLTRAREIVGNIGTSELGARTSKVLRPIMEQCDEMLERSRKATIVLSKATILSKELRSATDALPKRVSAWKKLEEQIIQSDVANAKLRVDQVIERFQAAVGNAGLSDRLSSLKEAQSEVASIIEEFTFNQKSKPFPQILSIEDVRKGSMEGVSEAQLSVGDKVLVRSLGKTFVTVIELPQKDGDFLTVQLGTLKMQVKSSDVLKTRKSGTESTPATVEKVSYKSRKPIMKIQANEASKTEPKYETAVQTSKNTLDLRGMRVDDSVRQLNLALASKSPGSVLFVIHGIGTGAVKEAVWQTLRKHPFVGKYEDESITNAGCTVVYIK